MDDRTVLLKELIKESLIEVYKNDYHLIRNQPLSSEGKDEYHHVGERSIVFRFAHYLQNNIDKDGTFKEYDLDCEYNRNGARTKQLPSFPNGTYPDVILHKRGRNNGNILIMEFKSYWNRDQGKDRIKIQQFTSQTGKYKFLYGATVLIGETPEKVIINGFIDGKEEKRFGLSI